MGPRPTTTTCDRNALAPMRRSGFRGWLQEGGLGSTLNPQPRSVPHTGAATAQNHQQRRGPGRPGVKFSLPTQPGAPGPWAPPSLTAHLPPITSTCHLGISPFSCLSPGSIGAGGKEKGDTMFAHYWGTPRGNREAGLSQPWPCPVPRCPCQLSTYLN